MAPNEPNPPKQSPLHPVYTVTNIQNKIRVLDGTTVTYTSWVKLFKLHARGYKVLHHIDGTPPPARTDTTYESWAEIDAIVLQWIYGTLSNDLLVRVLDTDTTAYKAWHRLQEIFTNNKGSRAAALEHEFTNLTLQSVSSLDEYCQKLKDLLDQLSDVESPVTEKRLVLQLVRGLPPEFDTVASFINQSLPSWDTACSMLQLELHRQSARQNHNNSTVMVTPSAPPSDDHLPNTHRDANNRPPGRGRGRNTHPGRSNRGGRSSHTNGRGRSYQPRPPVFPPPPAGLSYPPWAWWAPPPCPHPTAQQTSWPAPWPNQQISHSGPSHSAQFAAHAQQPPAQFPAQAQQPTFDALIPTDLGQAFQAMHLNQPDSSWYMDTGASTHLTADSGTEDWEDTFPPQ